MTKALASLLLLLQLTIFGAFAEDTFDAFNEILDFDVDDPLNAFSKEFETLHKPSHVHSLHHQSPAPSPHHYLHSPSPSPSPSPHHQSPASSPRHQSAAPSPHQQSTIVPAKPPTPSPLRPVPRSVMVVRGVVYVKSCKYSGLDTLKEATPLLGAVVKLRCNNSKYKLDETDKDGHFSLVGPKIITIHTAKQCNVVLVSAPHGLKPSNLHDGITGAILKPKRRFVSKGAIPFILFATHPLAFQPNCPR